MTISTHIWHIHKCPLSCSFSCNELLSGTSHEIDKISERSRIPVDVLRSAFRTRVGLALLAIALRAKDRGTIRTLLEPDFSSGDQTTCGAVGCHFRFFLWAQLIKSRTATWQPSHVSVFGLYFPNRLWPQAVTTAADCKKPPLSRTPKLRPLVRPTKKLCCKVATGTLSCAPAVGHFVCRSGR